MYAESCWKVKILYTEIVDTANKHYIERQMTFCVLQKYWSRNFLKKINGQFLTFEFSSI